MGAGLRVRRHFLGRLCLAAGEAAVKGRGRCLCFYGRRRGGGDLGGIETEGGDFVGEEGAGFAAGVLAAVLEPDLSCC